MADALFLRLGGKKVLGEGNDALEGSRPKAVLVCSDRGSSFVVLPQDGSRHGRRRNQGILVSLSGSSKRPRSSVVSVFIMSIEMNLRDS